MSDVDTNEMAARQAAYAAARREWWAMIERVLEVRLRELQEGKRDG